MAAQLCGTFKDEFVTSLAALALYDGDAEISAENINNLLKASNNVGVKPYWPVLISSILKGGKIESIIFSGGVAGGGNSTMAVTTSTTAAGEATSTTALAEKAKPEEKAKPKEEEVDALDGGMDMFGGGGGGGDY